ncbi:hypothetical protein BH11MYX4_BH11MYX4_34110 [soil metagenome]
MGRGVDFSVFDQINPLVVALDRSGRIDRWNPACSLLTGYSLDEARGKQIWDFLVPAAEIEAVRGVFAALRAGDFPSTFTNDWVTKSGELHTIRWSNTCIVDDKGELVFVLATGTAVIDRPSLVPDGVTARRQETALVLKTSFPMWVFDRGTLEFLAVNDAAIARYGYTREEFLASTVRTIRTPDLSLEEALLSLGDGVEWVGPVEHRTKTGEQIRVEIAMTPIELGGRAAAMVLVHEAK